MRASDRDRVQALALLRAGCAEGYMSVETFERRVAQTFAARTVSELRELVVVPGDELRLGSCPVRLD